MKMKTNINMFLFDIEHFLSDIMGPRYSHLKKVYFFAGLPVVTEDSLKKLSRIL